MCTRTACSPIIEEAGYFALNIRLVNRIKEGPWIQLLVLPLYKIIYFFHAGGAIATHYPLFFSF